LIKTGNVKWFPIDNTKEEVYGASECIGCSVMVAINGKELLMAHFAEESGQPLVIKTIESAAATQKQIIDHMEESGESDKFEEGSNGHAWFIHSSLQPRPAGAVLWKGYMQESMEMPENQVHIVHYTPLRRIGGGDDLEDNPRGKVVVTVTPQAAGEVIITLYSHRDAPIWSQRYDASGNPC
jgi:hypothetical protein